jgi:3',5'-cyclic AMP phosphodiesterase CpdA
MSSRRPITIVHLSDPQFGRNHRFGRLSPSAPDDSFDSLVGRLQEDLEKLQEDEGLTPDLLAVTGDLAEWGKKGEFEDVLQFLHRLAAVLGLGRERVLLVPGNHDINRKLCEAYFNECEAEETTPSEPYWRKLQYYANFFERYYEGLSGICFTEAEPWTFYEFEDLKVVAAGLNSTWKESHRPDDHYGWVGEKQLRWFAERLRTYKERGWLRLGLIHHNVLRRAQEDNENLRDADDLQRRLGGELNLLLHGHTHEARLGYLGRLPVLSTGSASVVVAARPQEVPNQYQLIRIFPDRIWFGARQYAPDQKRWIGDTRSSLSGNQWFHEEPVTLERVEATFALQSAETAARTDHLAAIVASYRIHVAETFQRQALYNLASLSEDQDIPGGLALLDIFVPQAVSVAPPARDLPQRLEPQGEPEAQAQALIVEPVPLPVEKALLDPKQPWALVLGAPGAGKTSLTRWLSLKLCTAGEAFPELSSEMVPVHMEMRRFDERYKAATTQGRSYGFFDYLDQEHAEKALSLRGDHLRELGSRGRLLWLFDGMDEVSDVSARQRYAEMIVGLRRAGPSRGIITSRIVGAQPILPCIQTAKIPVYTLLDFDEERIQEFIVRWHEKAFPGAPEARQLRQERLERLIEESAAVRDLCRNPLLLTLVALLNRSGELPRRRHLLYRRAVELMAAQWEANKQLPPAEVAFEFEDKLRYLRELARWMQFELEGGRGNLVGHEELLNFTSRFFQEHQGKSADQARRYANLLLSHLRERNYILARIGENRFGFVHKTFLEYLVAESIRSQFAGREIELDEIEKLFRSNWRNADWHEVLTLICGMLEEDRPANVLKVLQALLTELVVFDDEELSFGAFAVRCLAEVRQLDQEPIRAFMLRLADFIQYDISHLPDADYVLPYTMELIGPRWPERERWQQWALQEGHSFHGSALAGVCAISITPDEQQLQLFINLLNTRDEPLLWTQTLILSSIEEADLYSLLAGKHGGGERLRCAVAIAIIEQPKWVDEAPLPKALVQEAFHTLREIFQSSSNRSIQIRCAIHLAENEFDPLIKKMLSECLNDSSQPVYLAKKILAQLLRRAIQTGELKSRLKELWNQSLSTDSLTAAVKILLDAEHFEEAFELIHEWLSRNPSEKVEEILSEELLRQKPNPKLDSVLELWQREDRSETIRSIIARLTILESKQQHSVPQPNYISMSLKELLDLFKTGSVAIRQGVISALSRHYCPESLRPDARKMLREKASPEADFVSRLDAAKAMRILSIVPEEEWRQVFRELAGSCSDELVRVAAAQMLGVEGAPIIQWLAAHALDEKVRTQSAHALRSLELRAALQAVGRTSLTAPHQLT